MISDSDSGHFGGQRIHSLNRSGVTIFHCRHHYFSPSQPGRCGLSVSVGLLSRSWSSLAQTVWTPVTVSACLDPLLILLVRKKRKKRWELALRNQSSLQRPKQNPVLASDRATPMAPMAGFPKALLV